MGGFANRGVSHLFGKGPDRVADPFGTVDCRCFFGQDRGKGLIRKIPGKSGKSWKIGKVPKRAKRTKRTKRDKKDKKEGQVQIGKPPLGTPSLPALEIRVIRSNFSDRNTSRDRNFSIASVCVVMHSRSRFKSPSIVGFPSFDPHLQLFRNSFMLGLHLGTMQFRSHIGSQNNNREIPKESLKLKGAQTVKCKP